jgi:UDP-2,3-diacylglucosamine pyrophosphatase LpxH
MKFWRDKGQSRHRLGDADVLVTGHYHHLQIVQDGPRTWMQAPANDGGSRWYEETGGASTRAGTLTFTVDTDGWANVQILR